ncbi:hypothetical protein KP509_39G017400 [Ceratopteris richardii]|uniref:Uncharacterized protein n=1 Tax=Ceratopteris richardii TaxID=49495 RepID=A0A8T2PZ26_CERRI|nr:hypothetical protein KP509_39G017400 [Ceratopteris richardii]
MALLYRILLQPFRRVWCVTFGRRFRLQCIRGRRRSSCMLYKQVKSCGYQDVQIMWSLLEKKHLLRSQQSSS